MEGSVSELREDVLCQVVAEMAVSQYLALKLDESTAVAPREQLLTYASYVKHDSVWDKFLFSEL